ncbi:MAG TPA: UDP binding domain-containing protein, partial [Polyangiaceae bacterium]|nr:UDP binding domain-containing protein [Polyangiaceae bacterium]
AQRVVKLLARADARIQGARVGILGLTFKQDVPDLRNTKVMDMVHELRQFGIEPLVHDPIADRSGHAHECDVKLQPWSELVGLDAMIFAVPHKELLALPLEELTRPVREGGVFVDLKSTIDPAKLRRDIHYWSL